MLTEYEPMRDLILSQNKLLDLAEHQVEVSEQSLFEGIQDVLRSRGGERWKKLDELWLKTNGGIEIAIGFYPPESNLEVAAWMDLDGPKGEDSLIYRIFREEVPIPEPHYICELNRITFTDDDSMESNEERSAVNNSGDLGTARLMSLLADGHANTPLEDVSELPFAT